MARLFPALCIFVCLFGLSRAVAAEDKLLAQKVEFFEKQIRPILVKHCYECHGAEDPAGKLRLDTRAGWVRGGKTGPAIVPGNPSASLLMRAVTYRDKKLRMPPPDEGQLTARQIADLRNWIRQGAVDPRSGSTKATSIDAKAQSHWSFQPLKAPVIAPSAAHAIDFLLDKQLKKKGFIASRPADLRTLVRRATYDLHGLPPTAEQLKTLRAMFPKLIAELLASPRYGERWARHWLDVARYSDAKDGVLMYGDARIRPFAYTYRDYVIRAFNNDKPYDRFVREQLAADKLALPADSPDQAAMGLLTLGRMFDRNPHDVIDDRIDVVTRGFLGLTVTCSRCHDHKFDPIPTADYYSLYGVFASSIEPYQRPRIEAVTKKGQAFEKELAAKLKEVFESRRRHYERTLKTARDRTADYLVQVATTEPDISETSIFFLSLLPQQLRPQITYRWRTLIARRAFAEDPVFGPWHDMMANPVLRPKLWKQKGVDPRIIAGLATANPKTRAEIARAYGQIIRGVWGREYDLKQQIADIDADIESLKKTNMDLADIVAGGNGLGTGTKGRGIHPGTAKPTKGEAGFITIERHDTLIGATDNPYIDGVFVPKGHTATISSTGLKVKDLTPSSGQTWDYFKDGPSSGSTLNTIDGIDFSSPDNSLLGIHANKGITFDLQALRSEHKFGAARFKALLGHGGAKGQSQLDFAVYADGKRIVQALNFQAQQKGLAVDIPLPDSVRFLTLVVSEGKQGISHDQAILGNARIVPDKTQLVSAEKKKKIVALQTKKALLERDLSTLKPLVGDPLADVLLSRESPVWFPIDKVYHYLSRKDKDAFRGLVNQLDAISVKHKSAAGRAMVMVDAKPLYDPVIFQRGDPTLRGTPVPRRFLNIVSGGARIPFPHGSGRLDLANAIASAKNPLTARVWANRIWMHHFGEPLVPNPSDFGLRSKRPVQHELLDYLAVTLIKNGWRTKPLHSLIMTSRAYQRSSQLDGDPRFAKQLEADPTNRYLWHANRRRLDLEQMRDTMLVVSGQIDLTMYGRPVLITDSKNKRRTIYSFVERQNLPSIVQTFDFANADTSTARRVTTTVPQQALFVMNSPFVMAAAKALAAQTKGEVGERIESLYRIVLGRPPSADEIKLGRKFVKTESWQQFAQILLMTNELMFVD